MEGHHCRRRGNCCRWKADSGDGRGTLKMEGTSVQGGDVGREVGFGTHSGRVEEARLETRTGK